MSKKLKKLKARQAHISMMILNSLELNKVPIEPSNERSDPRELIRNEDWRRKSKKVSLTLATISCRIFFLALLHNVNVNIIPGCSAIGYSYSRFIGPVVGPEELVYVPDAQNGGSVPDFVAHPEYEFAYGVEDAETKVLQNRKETRIGDVVKGVYSVVDPDGHLRVVKYTADDKNGFRAEVLTDGIKTLHGHQYHNPNKDASYQTDPPETPKLLYHQSNGNGSPQVIVNHDYDSSEEQQEEPSATPTDDSESDSDEKPVHDTNYEDYDHHEKKKGDNIHYDDENYSAEDSYEEA